MDVYWRYCPAEDQAAHVEEIVGALFAALSSPARRWNPWTRQAVRAELRDRVEQASIGALAPVDHVKELRGGRVGLYEIRWPHINVTEAVDSGGVQHKVTGARLIHAEPYDELGIALLGLVAHEKPNQEDAKEVQDEAIDRAEQMFNEGHPQQWGVSRRTR